MGVIAMNTMAVVAPLAVLTVFGAGLMLRARRGSARPVVPAWSNTKGTVLSASVQVSQNGSGRSEHPLVFYAYQVNGEVFQGQRVRRVRNGLHAANIVDRYPAGASVVVYYDPADPRNCALEL